MGFFKTGFFKLDLENVKRPELRPARRQQNRSKCCSCNSRGLNVILQKPQHGRMTMFIRSPYPFWFPNTNCLTSADPHGFSIAPVHAINVLVSYDTANNDYNANASSSDAASAVSVVSAAGASSSASSVASAAAAEHGGVKVGVDNYQKRYTQ